MHHYAYAALNIFADGARLMFGLQVLPRARFMLTTSVAECVRSPKAKMSHMFVFFDFRRSIIFFKIESLCIYCRDRQ